MRHDHAEEAHVRAIQSHRAAEEQDRQNAPDCKSRRRDVTEPEVVFVLECLGRTKTLPYTVKSADLSSAQRAIKQHGNAGKSKA